MEKTDLKKKTAPFLILLAGCLWGSMGIFVRTLNTWGLASFEIVALRSFVTMTACELLVHSQKQVSEICYAVGFNDVPHFNRIFRKMKHMSPREYRNNHSCH